MRRVKFIRDLVVEEKTVYGEDDIREHHMPNLPLVPVMGEISAMDAVSDIEVRICPVHRICKPRMGGQPPAETYIAYTQEVQELLEIPYDALQNTIKLLEGILDTERAKLSRVDHADWKARLKYLFTRERP